jgi:predicted phage terminase large subunit-like protein
MTRLQPGAVALLTATRWHEDDLTGRVLSGARGSKWTVLSLPALAEDVDPLARSAGEALWPDWFDADALAAIRVEIGARAFASLFQQQPTPDKGRIFQRAWLTGRYERIPDGARLIQTVDSAFKTGVANDWSVIATWAAAGSGFLLVDVWRQRVEFPDLVKAIKTQAKTHHPTAILIEDTAAGQSAIQVLKRETSLPIVAAPAKGSKVSRADAVSPLFESGRVFLPSPEPAWLAEWIEEHVKFDQGKHDDQVDTTSMALERLRSGRGGAGIAGVVHHARPGDRRRELAQQSTDDALREHEAAKQRRAAQRERERERAAARPLAETDPRFAG